MKIQSRREGFHIDGNYVPSWLAVVIIFFYALFLVVRAAVKVLVWLCKRISGAFKARRGRREAERLRKLRTPYNRTPGDHFPV